MGEKWEIEFEEWVEKYNPIREEKTNRIMTFGSHKAFPDEVLLDNDKLDITKVWTLTESDGFWVIMRGYYRINQMGYIITQADIVEEDCEDRCYFCDGYDDKIGNERLKCFY